MAERDTSDDPLTGSRREELRDNDDEWVGTSARHDRPAERLEIDRDSVEHVVLIEPGLRDDIPRASRPRIAETRPEPRLRLGDREATPLHIINNDDRKVYNDWRYPWGLVCRVNGTGGSFGSGVLVGPRHVLTASHVVDWNNLILSVDVHAFDGAARASAIVDAAGCYTQVTDSDGFSSSDEDYAVLVLDQRLGDRFGWMGVRTYNSSWDERELWETMGYAEDVSAAGRPLFENPFYLDEDALDYGWGRAMSTNADLEHGQSGSPIFAFWDEGPYAVAVVVAEVGDDNYCAGGTGLTSLVGGVRAAYP